MKKLLNSILAFVFITASLSSLAMAAAVHVAGGLGNDDWVTIYALHYDERQGIYQKLTPPVFNQWVAKGETWHVDIPKYWTGKEVHGWIDEYRPGPDPAPSWVDMGFCVADFRDDAWTMCPLHTLNLDYSDINPLPELHDTSGTFDHLYVAVELNAWATTSMDTLFAAYYLTDGESGDLPGYIIGTSPIYIDPSAGPNDNPFTTDSPVTAQLVMHDTVTIVTAYTAVQLASLSAEQHDGYIELIWATGNEIDNAGFNIYRSTEESGAKVLLNSEMIPALGDEVNGATYFYRDGDIVKGATYYYWFEDIDLSGNSTMHGPVKAEPAAESSLPDASIFSLAQNYPNPFNPSTEIRYTLPEACHVTLEVFDVSGKRIAVLADERQEAGSKISHWNGTDSNGATVSSGVYFYKLQAGDFVEVKKMILAR
jgi:hypothetical protein